MAKPTKTKILVKKKKKWYTAVAPKDLNNVVIGEVPSSDPESLKGRILKVSIMTLTNEMKKQNMIATFRITGVKESTAETELVGYTVSPAHTKRLVKRARSKIDDSFKCETKDKNKIVIKPLLLIKKKIQRNVQTSLRIAAREALAAEAKNKTLTEMVLDILDGTTQKGLKQALRKVYPVNVAEIRTVELA